MHFGFTEEQDLLRQEVRKFLAAHCPLEEVRKLMESQLLGTAGAISWDGLLDDGSKGRIGPYIVVFEVFDLEGNTELYKKTVTLAHRLD